MSKHIYTLGTSLSSIGKGIVSASLGRILKSFGYNVTIQKFDGYLNSSASSLSPLEHGECYIVDNKIKHNPRETDLDISTYENFLCEDLTADNSLTSGIIYSNVLRNEREGKYLGETIQIIPHITNEIKKYMHIFDNDKDIIIHEIGGTAGCDIEVWPYTEAIRQMQSELPANDCLIILLVFLPYLKVTQEIKTKIAQQGVERIRSLGLNPDILICRSELDFDESIKKKLSLFTGIPQENIIKNVNAQSIYDIPKMLVDANILDAISRKLNLDLKDKTKLDNWNNLVLNNVVNKEITIGVVGKYVKLHDSYKSIVSSIKFASWKNRVKTHIKWLSAEDLEHDQSLLATCQGLIICPGFGYRGFEGKVIACKYAREHKIPLLGICFGAQAGWIEFARNVLNITDASSEEFVEENIHSNNYIVHLMPEQKNIKDKANTLRLGYYPCKLAVNSLAYKYYQDENIMLKHRHRFEFNNEYLLQFISNGMKVSGQYNDQLVEITELIDHPFYVLTQGHPEMDSKPDKPNPLFDGFIASI